MVTPTTPIGTVDQALEQVPVANPEPTSVSEAAPPAIPVPKPASVPATDQPTVSALQEEVANLRRQAAQANMARATAMSQETLQREAQAVYDEELAAGLSAEDALRIAKRHYATSAQGMAQRQHDQYRQIAAEHVANKYKVPVGPLLSGTSGEHMEAIAQGLILEKRLAALEQRQVPPQRLDSSSTGGAANVVATADNIDKLWFDYETQHPGAPNPYDAAYRRAMAR